MRRDLRSCRVDVAGVHAQPDSESERETEISFGEPVRLLLEDGGWSRIRVADGYEGWVAPGVLGTAAEHENSGEGGRVVVTALQAPVGEGPPASYGGIFPVLEERAHGFLVALPDGALGELSTRDAQPVGAAMRVAGGEAVVAEARRFIGTPYLWGGCTSRGIDCSGLVQAIHRRFVHLLPRNADDQEAAGVAVAEGEPWRPGDLLCYGDHIAIWTDRETIVHAFGRAGAVVETEHYPELQGSLRTVRRVFADA